MPQADCLETTSSALDLVRQGDAHRKAGDFSRAEEAYRRATTLDPKCSGAWSELGCLLADCRRFSEAIACFGQVLGRDAKGEAPDSAQVCAELLLEVTWARPDWARGQFTLGSTYEHLEDFEHARKHLANALELDRSREAAVQSLFARMFSLEKKWTEGLAAADRAIAAKPGYFLAHVIRSKCCAELADWSGSAESMRRALDSAPHMQFHSDLLFDMNYLPETTPESMYQEACRWNALYAAPLASEIRPHSNTPDPERRLKIGYVSPDLHAHPITKFLMPVLELHDRSRFEIFIYAVGPKSDHVTDWIREKNENFTAIGASDRALDERVRADGIDILIDLAGHTTGAAYLAFARKPAPVQVSWLGVLSTTGVSTIDYFIGDAHMPCPGTEDLFSEVVYRLPRSLCCYRPTADVPVAPSPYFARGHITFGCFNNPRKINRDVVKLWSAILHLVPESRLLLKWHGMEEGIKRNRLTASFAEDGITPERLRFAGGTTTTKYLEEYGEIDIALDPFPYNGGSTTLDTLWMGVPVITLAGRTAVQRTGTSILNAMGLPDLVAYSAEQYLNAALCVAALVPQMPSLRQEVRQSLKTSPLMDEAGHVRDVENAYREMWRAWCAAKAQAI